jgi:ABC-type amino acid transport system permease subunit
VILRTNGKSVLILMVLAICYLAITAAFTWASRSLEMNKGTESLVAERV